MVGFELHSASRYGGTAELIPELNLARFRAELQLSREAHPGLHEASEFGSADSREATCH
jgi:hypothetical protein